MISNPSRYRCGRLKTICEISLLTRHNSRKTFYAYIKNFVLMTRHAIRSFVFGAIWQIIAKKLEAADGPQCGCEADNLNIHYWIIIVDN